MILFYNNFLKYIPISIDFKKKMRPIKFTYIDIINIVRSICKS